MSQSEGAPAPGPVRTVQRNLVEMMHAELQQQYAEAGSLLEAAIKEVERLRANANAARGALQFADKLLRVSDELEGETTRVQPQQNQVECSKTEHKGEVVPDA